MVFSRAFVQNIFFETFLYIQRNIFHKIYDHVCNSKICFLLLKMCILPAELSDEFKLNIREFCKYAMVNVKNVRRKKQ